jgi:hypothetical protein
MKNLTGALNILTLKPALEDLENGVAAKEKEYVWYGVGDNFIISKIQTQ